MSNKIEKIIRHYVTKALSEIVSDLDKVVEQKVKVQVEQRLRLADLLQEQAPKTKPVLHEVFETEQPVQSAQPAPAPTRRKLTADDLGITEDTWRSVYEDTLGSENPILTEEHVPAPGEISQTDKPELVSESAMEQFGFMRDFSKHVDAFEKIDKKKNHVSEGDQKAQELYRAALMKVDRNV